MGISGICSTHYSCIMRLLYVVIFGCISMSSNFQYVDIFKIPQFRRMLDAFRENSTMEDIIEKVDELALLLTKVLNIKIFSKVIAKGLERQLCKLFGLQLFLHSRIQKVYDIMRRILEMSGYLRIPLNSSLINNVDFDYSENLLLEIVQASNVNYMKNMVLKFDDPFKTGECLSCTLKSETAAGV